MPFQEIAVILYAELFSVVIFDFKSVSVIKAISKSEGVCQLRFS